MTVSEQAVRASVGVSESFDTVEAAAEASDRARTGLEPSCDLAVVFASGNHLGMAKWLLSEVHERLEPQALIGCGAGGTVADGHEMEDTPSVVVWAASLPGAELETMHLTAERDAEGFRLLGLPEELTGAAAEGDAPDDESVIALCDPFSFPAEELIVALERNRPGAPMIGGLSSASFAGGAMLLRDGEVHTDGAVALRMRGIEVLPCVSQGAGPVGPEMTITSAEANVIAELAGKPAMERLGEVITALPERERELAAAGVLIGLVIDENRPEYERGDFLARPIIGADRASGAIAIGEPVRVGQTVRLQVRDAASADADLREALRAQTQALGSDGAAGALLFTCNGRGSHMFEVPDHDASAIEDSLGAPTAGFFCAGEIGPVGGRNFLHGFTATMAVFPA
ncbi:MAG TPA: FIST N-terminal domain-containing protein [Solirubrobacterales bacterium]|nr:FIST N-terminal domain-containing protein [Solirubrobacterales bacterium]